MDKGENRKLEGENVKKQTKRIIYRVVIICVVVFMVLLSVL
ncbi:MULTISPECIES: hypothetical protein [Erysipelotrichaceae]|nr:hypothetical protein [Absiella sp. AM29-15]